MPIYSTRFHFITVQEAVKGSVLRKYPNNTVNLAVAKSPDLAIVQGAAHCVPLQQQPPPGGGGQYPVAPQFNSIVSANSYGIVVAEVWARRLSSVVFLSGSIIRVILEEVCCIKYTVQSCCNNFFFFFEIMIWVSMTYLTNLSTGWLDELTALVFI